jgi:hypothetical protein
LLLRLAITRIGSQFIFQFGNFLAAGLRLLVLKSRMRNSRTSRRKPAARKLPNWKINWLPIRVMKQRINFISVATAFGK